MLPSGSAASAAGPQGSFLHPQEPEVTRTMNSVTHPLRTLLCAFCLLATACDALPSGIDPNLDGDGPGETPKVQLIAFESHRDGNAEVYVMSPDGTKPTNLTKHPEPDRFPAWSPDRTKIAFTRGDGDGRIVVMKADGTNPIEITDGSDDERFPTWSPDGTRIAFTRGPVIGSDLWVVNADGTGLRSLTQSSASDGRPSWSPDGRRIAFRRWRPGDDIYAIDVDGSNLTRVTTGLAPQYPDWSPDGTKIAYASSRGEARYDVYVVNADGTNDLRLTNSGEHDGAPNWSPDGRRIVFTSYRDGGDAEIYIMNSDGTNQERLTRSPGLDLNPAWTD